MSGRGYLRLISRLQGQGRQVELIYLALPDAEMSRLRVKERVKHGGHDVPTNVISRRFLRTLKNLLADYAGAASKTRCIMNSSYQPLVVVLFISSDFVHIKIRHILGNCRFKILS